jgi:hypothetical protein
MEHLIVLLILLRRIKAVDLVGELLEGGLVSLHLLDVIGSESVVMDLSSLRLLYAW